MCRCSTRTMSTSAFHRALPRRRRLWPYAVAGAAVVLAGGGAAAYGLGLLRRVLPAPPEHAAVEDRPAPTGDQPAAVASTAKAPLIELNIAVTPADATIYLDDVAVQHQPFSAKFPADRTAHKLVVAAAGHRSHTQLLVFDEDLTLALSLEPLADASASAEASASAAVAPAPVRTGAAAAKPAGAWPRGTKVDTTDPFAKGKTKK